MIRRHCVGIALAAAVCSLLCVAVMQLRSATNSMESEKIDAILTAAGLKSTNVPGAAVLVLKNGETLFERSYGVTDLKTLHRIDERTNFRLASFTKQFTAMAIMLLVRDGKLIFPSMERPLRSACC